MSLADTADTNNFINEKDGNWKPIKDAPRDGTVIDLWLNVYASPRSMGMSDEYGVPDAWFENGKWVHTYKGKSAELYSDYITHYRAKATGSP